MAARADQLALFIVEFVAAAWAPAPVFALAIAGVMVFLRRGFSPRTRILLASGHRGTFSQEALSIKCDSMNPFEEPGQGKGAASYHLEDAEVRVPALRHVGISWGRPAFSGVKSIRARSCPYRILARQFS